MIGPATGAPPANPPGVEDPGQVFKYGPNFVRFVVDRFAFVEQTLARILQVAAMRDREGQRFLSGGQTDGSGNVTIEIFRTAPGQKFVAHRVYVHAQGYTWAVPYTGAGEVLLEVDGQPWSGASLVSGSGQLPCYFTSGRLHAVEAQAGEVMQLQINGGPASTRIEVRTLGVLATVYGDDAS